MNKKADKARLPVTLVVEDDDSVVNMLVTFTENVRSSLFLLQMYVPVSSLARLLMVRLYPDPGTVFKLYLSISCSGIISPARQNRKASTPGFCSHQSTLADVTVMLHSSVRCSPAATAITELPTPTTNKVTVDFQSNSRF